MILNLAAGELDLFFERSHASAVDVVVESDLNEEHAATVFAARFAGIAVVGPGAVLGYTYLAANVEGGRIFKVSSGTHECYVEQRFAPRRVIVFAADPLTNARWCIRVVRDALNKFAEERGAIHLHASCVDIDGSAILYVGDKGAGKTTLLIDALTRSPNRRFVSNDRVTLFVDDNTTFVRGQPLSVRVGRATLLQTPSLFAGLQAEGNILFDAQDKVTVRCAQFVRVLQIGTAKRSRLQLCVFPTLSPGTPIAVRKISLSAALPLLRRQLLIPDDGFPDWLHFRSRSVASLRAAAIRCLAQMFRETRFVTLSFGDRQLGDVQHLIIT